MTGQVPAGSPPWLILALALVGAITTALTGWLAWKQHKQSGIVELAKVRADTAADTATQLEGRVEAGAAQTSRHELSLADDRQALAIMSYMLEAAHDDKIQYDTDRTEWATERARLEKRADAMHRKSRSDALECKKRIAALELQVRELTKT